MALDKLVDSARLDGALSATADAIRNVKDSTDPIEWDADTGFADALDGISGGGGGDDRVKQLVEGTITELSDDTVTEVRPYAFYIGSLISVNLPNATSVGNNAFYRCSALSSIAFPNATSLGNYAFQSCSSLPSAVFPNVTSFGTGAFQSCSALSFADFPNVTSISDSAFSGCSKLSSIVFPNATKIAGTAFMSCKALPSVDFPNVTSIASQAFISCSKLDTVVLRSNQICTLSNTNAFNATPFASGGTGGIVLCPATLIPQYISATNWSTLHAAGTCRFLPLEGYTVDGTTTGAINWEKLEADREGAFA